MTALVELVGLDPCSTNPAHAYTRELLASVPDGSGDWP